MAKGDFEAMSLNDFRAKYAPIFKNVGNVAVHTFLSFHALICAKVAFPQLSV